MLKLKSYQAVMGVLVCLLSAAIATAAHAAAWSSTAQYGTWSNGGYTVANDIWGTSPGTQTIWANSYSNWGVSCNYSGGGIKSYPHCEKGFNNSVSSLTPGTLTSSFNATTPGNTSYDLAYDIWCNNYAYETMIWMSWNGTQPIAASYNAQGVAIPTLTNQYIDGQYWNVYRRGTVVSLLRANQTSSGSVDIGQVLQFVNNQGWFNNPVLNSVQFGWEIINTGGSWQNFNMNSFSVTQSSGGSGGGGGNLVANGTYSLICRNGGEALDVPGWSTAGGVQLDQWASSGNNNQRFQLTNLGNNVVSLINVNSNKAVEVYGFSTANGAEVDQWPYWGGVGQQWKVASAGGGYYTLTNLNSGQNLDVSGASTANGALIDQWPSNGGANQQWSFH